MFQSIDKSISIGYIYSITKSLFLVLILIENFGDIDSVVFILANRVILQFGAMAKPLVDFIEICIIVWLFFIDFVEVGFTRWNMDALVDVIRLKFEVFYRIRLQTFKLLQIFVKRHIGFSDKAVSLNFAQNEISDLIMDNPVFFFVDIVFILYFLLNVFVDFWKIDDIIIHYRKILVLKGVYCFPDAVLVCQEVSLFEINMFFYDILKRYQDLLLDLEGDKENISLDVIYNRLVVCHQSEVFVPGRFHQLYRRLMIRKLCEFSCEWMEKID